MRAWLPVFCPLLLSGCLFWYPPPEPAPQPEPPCHGDLPTPYGERTVRVREAQLLPLAAPFEASPAHPSPAAMDAYVRELWASRKPGAASSAEGGLVVCRLVVKRAQSYMHTYPILPFSIATVDVWPNARIRASLAGDTFELEERLSPERYILRRRPFTKGARVSLQVLLTGALQDNLIGKVDGKFDGSFPVASANPDLDLDCREIDGQEVAAAAREQQRLLDDRLRTYGKPGDSYATWTELVNLLGRLAVLVGEDDPRVTTTGVRIGEESVRAHNERLEALAEQVRAATPVGTWAALDTSVEARLTGLLCQEGDRSLLHCALRLEARIRAGHPQLCPIDADRFGPIRGFAGSFETGQPAPFSIHSVSRPANGVLGPLFQRVDELAHPSPGDTFVLEIGIDGGFMTSKDGTPKEFAIPLLEVRLDGGKSLFFRTG